MSNEITGRTSWDIVNKIGIVKSLIISLFILLILIGIFYFILSKLDPGTKIEISNKKLMIEKKPEEVSPLKENVSVEQEDSTRSRNVDNMSPQKQALPKSKTIHKEQYTGISTSFFDSNSKHYWATPNFGPMTWTRANEFAKSIAINGKKGWRLPSLSEFKSLLSSESSYALRFQKDYYWTSQSKINFAVTINPFTKDTRLVSKSSNSFLTLIN